MSKANGGFAFPQSDPIANEFNNSFGTDRGMTLRDYFAAKAMQAQVITDMVPGEACDALMSAAEAAGEDPTYRLAVNSYEIADAMLKARAK